MIKENQSKFTEKGGIANNLMILKHCIHQSFKDRKTLYVTAVDFSKALDSVKKDNLIGVLLDYQLHPNLIEVIVDLYTGDTTNIVLDKDKHSEMNVSSGIRQGCTASTTLFKLLTYKIIERLKDVGGYKN